MRHDLHIGDVDLKAEEFVLLGIVGPRGGVVTKVVEVNRGFFILLTQLHKRGLISQNILLQLVVKVGWPGCLERFSDHFRFRFDCVGRVVILAGSDPLAVID